MRRFFTYILFLICLIYFFQGICSEVRAESEIGAFVGNPNGIPPTAEEVRAFEALTQRHVSSIQVFWTWEEGAFPADELTSGVAYHDGYDTQTSLQLSWEPWSRLGADDYSYSLASINDGIHDAFVAEFARDCRDWQRPIRLRFAHEMIAPPDSDTWYPWQNRPAEYTQAWNRIHGIFKDEGADNVEFVWAPLSYPADTQTLSQYFPGKDKVDWLGMGGHNHGEDGQPGFPYWQSFHDIFFNLYNTYINNTDTFGDKPIMVAEFSSAEMNLQDSRTKADWIYDAFWRLQHEYPEVEAFYWFNTIKGRDWRIDSSPEALAAFQAMMESEYFLSHPVPEPQTLLLLGFGLPAILFFAGKRRT